MNIRRYAAIPFSMLVIVVLSAPATAQLSIDWWTVDGGGGAAAGGAYSVRGTIGQTDPDDSETALHGGQFTLIGGFWSADNGLCDLVGDLEPDGDVDLTDLATLLTNFGIPSGENRQSGDLDGDGDVDLSDLSRLLANFGLTCG